MVRIECSSEAVGIRVNIPTCVEQNQEARLGWQVGLPHRGQGNVTGKARPPAVVPGKLAVSAD